MNKFEQLIEYVINDEEEKARALFHDIVVEKSRNIYEEIMSDEDEDLDESKDEDLDEDLDESKDEDLDEAFGDDASDNLINDVEADEEGFSMEGEDSDDHHDDVGGDEELEDRVVDLEDKLEELMAEFEELMGGGNDMDGMDGMDDMGDMDSMGDMDGMDGMDDEEIEIDDTESETEGMMEAVTLKSAPTPVKNEEGNTNKKSVVAANSGSTGMDARPVSEKGGEEKGRPAPQAKEIIGKVGNTPAQSTQKPSAAPSATTKEPAGINTKSINR